MKKNNKGFFLAEAIVMIALVTTVMAYVYPNVSKLYEEFKLQTKVYDQIQDIYSLKYIYEKEFALYKVNPNNSQLFNETKFNCSGKNLPGQKKISNLINLNFASSYIDIYDPNKGQLKNLYIVSYMKNGYSGTDYNFKKYLNRMKKTNNDPSAYRLIGVFSDGSITRYSSIKIDNPNPTRECNLGESF